MIGWLWRLVFGGPKADTRGTTFHNVQVMDVIDGDTIKVKLNGKVESLRLVVVDTEESQKGGSKPITRAGKMASEMAKAYFKEGNGFCKVSLEFETDKSKEWCLKTLRGTYGRLLCHVHKGKEHYNLKLVKEGWSPYFGKYGFSQYYHDEFNEAHEEARKNKLVIWDPETNKGGPSRDYKKLLPWWKKRGEALDEFYEHGSKKGALSLHLDYEEVVSKAGTDEEVVILADLQQGVTYWAARGAIVGLYMEKRPFSLWIPGVTEEEPGPIVERIQKHYARRGRGYAYIRGKVTMHKDKPQIVVKKRRQIQDSVD